MATEFPIDTDVLLEVLNRLNLGVYVTDLDRRIMLWNRKAEEITGYRAADVVGTACWDNVLQHVDKDGHKLCTTRFCPLFRVMNLGVENAQPMLVFAKKANGRRVAVSVSAAPLRDASGAVVGGIETFRDETRQVADMEFAAKVQRHLFPRRLPENDRIAFDVRYFPHDLVGGDFYDVTPLARDRFGVLVADVRGHGVSAALYTMWLKSLEANFAERAEDPPAMITALNRTLARFALSESFATGLYAVVDSTQSTFTYSNAGHPPPLHHAAATREVHQLESHGMPLGVTADETYEASSITLAPGDVVFCYTDGLADVSDAEGKMLTPESLSEILAREITRGENSLLDRMYAAVLEISREVALVDDCLMLTVSRKG